ncbi:MAG: hypothetical protein ABSB88_18400 [Bryobacteraceae bacterium]
MIRSGGAGLGNLPRLAFLQGRIRSVCTSVRSRRNSRAGAAAGALAQLVTGYVVRFSYLPCFLYAGSAYLLAVGVIQLLSPRLEPADLD